MKNIFVIGGSGFVGTQVCKQLTDAGHRVTVPTRQRSSTRHLQPLPSLTVIEIDIHNEVALIEAMAGHDVVINLVAILHGTLAEFERVHVQLPGKIARACGKNGVQHLVHISALGVNGSDPMQAPSMYLRSKGQGEALLKAASRDCFQLTLLRPSVIFGKDDKFLNLFAKLQQIFLFMPLAGAQARFQPVWVDDAAAAIVRCIARETHPGDSSLVLEICGPRTFTLKELVQIAGRLGGTNHGKGRPVFALPAWAARMQATAMEWAPGATVMSRDNLASMQVDNVATAGCAGLEFLGIHPADLEVVAASYLKSTLQ
jgi:NADH dehydrogenase